MLPATAALHLARRPAADDLAGDGRRVADGIEWRGAPRARRALTGLREAAALMAIGAAALVPWIAAVP